MKNRAIIRRLALCAMLAAFALVTFVIEMQIPSPVPFPGVKLGLANIFTLVTLRLYGRREAAGVLAVRIVLGALFTGTLTMFFYSLAGGVCCFLVMAAVYKALGEKLTWVTSVLGALAHNAGQMLVAFAVLGKSILFYFPILVISGIITGAFTGIAAAAVIRAVGKAGAGSGK